MKTEEYLDRLLLCYGDTFDIYMPYQIHGKEYPAYGYFFSSEERYVLVREANMWTANRHEHILFMQVDKIEEETIKEAADIIETYLEPELVRAGKKYPDKDHMYSYLTVAILSERAIDRDVAKKIRRYQFERGYLFNFRGFSQGNLICASMEDEKIVTNYQGKRMKKMYQGIFADVREGKKTFSQACKEDGIEPFKQQ